MFCLWVFYFKILTWLKSKKYIQQNNLGRGCFFLLGTVSLLFQGLGLCSSLVTMAGDALYFFFQHWNCLAPTWLGSGLTTRNSLKLCKGLTILNFDCCHTTLCRSQPTGKPCDSSVPIAAGSSFQTQIFVTWYLKYSALNGSRIQMYLSKKHFFSQM